MDDHQTKVRTIEELGALVRKGRKAQGLTQQQFADIAGVGVRFVSELERGKQTAEVGLVLHVLQLAGYDLVLQQKGVRKLRSDG